MTTTARITGDRLTEFEPSGIGSMAPTFRQLLVQIRGKKQSEIIALIESGLKATGDPNETVDALAFRVTLLVLRDYVEAGYYPVVRGGRCYMASVTDSTSLTDDQRRRLLQHQYQASRNRAMRERGQVAWLKESVRHLHQSGYAAHDVLARMLSGPPDAMLLDTRESTSDFDTRTLWRYVRSTWSMTPETSAPGRELAFVAIDRSWPSTPLGILQFRNVVPGINARDLWLGTSLGEVGGPVNMGNGFLGLLMAPGENPSVRAKSTLRMLESLCANIQTEGVEVDFEVGNIDALGAFVRFHREKFDETRHTGQQGLLNDHLRLVKRAQTAQDLLRGIRGLHSILSHAPDLGSLGPDTRRDISAGLSKIWHYQMGFVALEMSICGAAPPFGPLRTGKLMASLAGSTEVIEKWGRDRPLGLIAQEVYRPEVRDHIPDHGPLVVFTSGLFPGHSAQYNRVTSGTQRWKKIGETSGYGSFHISFETTEAMRQLNEQAEGYQHVTRRFGEGSGARFRSVGRALGYLGLPDLRKHETKRPLYALPLVRNPQATILNSGGSRSSSTSNLPRAGRRLVEPLGRILICRPCQVGKGIARPGVFAVCDLALESL